MKNDDAYPMHMSPPCKAHSKCTGLPCKAPAVRGWTECRMHGARGGAKPGESHPGWKHGARTQQAIELRGLSAAIRSIAKSLGERGAEG